MIRSGRSDELTLESDSFQHRSNPVRQQHSVRAGTCLGGSYQVDSWRLDVLGQFGDTVAQEIRPRTAHVS
jgi:hypothetical protein